MPHPRPPDRPAPRRRAARSRPAEALALVPALVLALALAITGCGEDAGGDAGGGEDAGGDEGGGAVPVDAATVAAADLDLGADVYQERCAVCHGADGDGGVGPSLRSAAEDLTVEEHLEVVWDGREGMPAFGGQLGEDELAAVVRYEREGW